ncbi:MULTISPECIES: hypothetical protein [Bacillus subtilis group]|uniref:hypothetical protein n=1 Tax=Bacillus subtilis group TaxID=653685 RepID=UPI0016622231|nr:hypothetical protein [Bacillus halotolerans]MBV7320316.1 hypothetical protein [Halalkalibacterium halodurans]QNS20868.1 hypothetical protein ICJ61_03205 [Bacillus halotolerans]
MSRRKTKAKKPNENKKGKEFLVISKHPDDYKPFDIRANKPICYKGDTIKGETGSIVLQEIENVGFSSKPKGKKNTIDYFAPNNVGILLSIANKALLSAKKIFQEKLNPNTVNHFEDDNKFGREETIIQNSGMMYDFIESVQVGIVFGYTALETFANLSIPQNYEYKSDMNNKGIIEIYDKSAIERWITLRMKISEILVKIYDTDSIKNKKIWNDFLEFEKLRHEIIHQKSVEDTKFYHKYFKRDFFRICEVPEKIISFFYEEYEGKEKTNPLWPWIINTEGGIPISYKFKAEQFEIIGNIYEGRKK